MSLFWKHLTVLGLLAFALAGCTRPPDAWKEAKPGQKRVLVSFPPLYSLTQAVAGDDAYVLTLLTGTGPHDYQYSSQDALKFRAADLVIVNGLELDEHFVDKLKRSSGNKNVPMFRVGDALPKELLRPMEECDHHDHAGHKHHHGEFDPHVWLGPPQAIVVVEKIADKLAELDPEHASGYRQRAEKIVGELKKLHEEGLAALKGKQGKNILTMHESMRYFADAFQLNVVGSIQAQAGLDPDAARLAKLEKQSREQNVAAIAYEPQFPKAQAEVLQRQLAKRGLDVKLFEFDPLETAQTEFGRPNPDPNYFLTKMRQNIDNLVKALP